MLCTAVRRCCKGTGCPRLLCSALPRVWRSTWLRVNQGTENPLVPGWDFHSESAEEKERLLPCPLLALGAVGGCCYSFPVQSSSAYLEENQTWKRLRLSPFQHLSATEGCGPSEVSMSAGSTEGREGNSALPAREVLQEGWAGPGRGWGWAGSCRGCGDGLSFPGDAGTGPQVSPAANRGTLSLLSGCSLSDTSRVTSVTQPRFAGGAAPGQQLPLLSARAHPRGALCSH